MKKIILILVVALSVMISCKKKEVKSESKITYCIFYKQTCVGCQPRVFYKCTDSKTEMQSALISLRDAGKESEVTQKSTCSECQ